MFFLVGNRTHLKLVHMNRLFYAIALVIGQIINIVSTFYWHDDGRYSINASLFIILAMVFWAVGFNGLFDLFKEKKPWYARIGLLYALYGCIGGAGFGFEGIYSEIFNVSEKIAVTAYQKYPLQMNVSLFWSGPAFPLSLMIIGFMFIYQKINSFWGVLFILGGIAFPVSRILRIESVAHLADIVLLIPLVLMLVDAVKKMSAEQLVVAGDGRSK
jgi:hypothetical protein